MELKDDGPEAGQWLANNGNPAGFASNRFNMDEAREFVASLYAAGSTRVYIPQERIFSDDTEMAEGGLYADALVVEFDPGNCAEIVRIYKRDSERAGYVNWDFDGQDIGAEGRLFFWWD